MATKSETAAAPVWEVTLPDRRRASLGASKPRATLIINPETPQEERRLIPAAVGRLLASKHKAGELHPQSRAELLYMVGELSRSCASTRVERLLNRRDYSSAEVTQKLRFDGYAPTVVEACVERACNIGLICDTRYADVFIRSKLSAGWGLARIKTELSRRGVDVEQLRGWPYDYVDPEDEITRAVEVAHRKSVSGARAYGKLVRFLCNRGFAMGVATRAARLVLEEQEDDELIGF